MCGRDWRDIEAGALFGVGYFPYKRRADAARANEQLVAAGRAIDQLHGEFEGVNAAMRELSHGTVSRVALHSVREYPHTSCGCFHYLAFWIDELGAAGVMHRGFPGRAPNGATWDALANRAGGKQSPGVTGVAAAYVQLPSFLRGDGGMANVAWMTRKVRDSAGAVATGVATEDDVTTLDDLTAHFQRRTHR
jgi:acetyl-CoA decarbonylase/synthase complex subunit beta